MNDLNQVMANLSGGYAPFPSQVQQQQQQQPDGEMCFGGNVDCMADGNEAAYGLQEEESELGTASQLGDNSELLDMSISPNSSEADPTDLSMMSDEEFVGEMGSPSADGHQVDNEDVIVDLEGLYDGPNEGGNDLVYRWPESMLSPQPRDRNQPFPALMSDALANIVQSVGNQEHGAMSPPLMGPSAAANEEYILVLYEGFSEELVRIWEIVKAIVNLMDNLLALAGHSVQITVESLIGATVIMQGNLEGHQVRDWNLFQQQMNGFAQIAKPRQLLFVFGHH